MKAANVMSTDLGCLTAHAINRPISFKFTLTVYIVHIVARIHFFLLIHNIQAEAGFTITQTVHCITKWLINPLECNTLPLTSKIVWR